jgi:divalent metal cation (Fe/Co/Zn/Cd) transporter
MCTAVLAIGANILGMAQSSIADGNHARTDGLVSLAVMLCAALVALGLLIAARSSRSQSRP